MRRACALVLLTVVAGCGGGSKPKTTATFDRTSPAAAPANTPLAVARAYVTAVGAGDYPSACALLSRNTMQEDTQGGKISCTKHYRDVIAAVPGATGYFKSATVGGLQVKGDNATVVMRSSNGKHSQFSLVREGGRWRVAS